MNQRDDIKRYTVDIPSIINSLGGNTKLHRRYLKTFGGELSAKTVVQWKSRNSMPLQRFLDVMQIAERSGKKIRINRGG